jgi:hypothetical protein
VPTFPTQGFIDGAQRELAVLGRAIGGACAVTSGTGDRTTQPGDPADCGTGDVVRALVSVRASVEARMARLVFNGDDGRDEAADDLERALGVLRAGVNALAADEEAAGEEAPDRYHAAAERQVRAWQSAVDLLALDAYSRGLAPGDDVVFLGGQLATLRRRLRWGPGPGSWHTAREDIERPLAEVRTRWARTVRNTGCPPAPVLQLSAGDTRRPVPVRVARDAAAPLPRTAGRATGRRGR